ncbi:zf-HC2 domain-containing protein [Streptomyces sp. H27-C3]|uniref:zf-HC2 domain-containing protein n=1 Tax=Streptomyces sp. H27-C3 TaxID=3046305 RepID=UPI0024B8B344|nr:zf-HC2 domain-containing protein [Streptomyces sp. H27-C3]MDJ0465307.1 zf-HC2 domain-containing protein [Streptomyces sp. H27-C3]
MTVPSPSGGAHVRLQLGAYVLGALSPGEDAEVAFHLGRCDVCRAAYLEVADAPALLALFSEDDLAPERDE